MSRIAPKLLTALFVLGCGSGAMASPNRGQWAEAGSDQQGYPSQGTYPSQTYSPQGGYQGSTQPQGGYQAQGAQGPQSYPSQGAPSQGAPSQGAPSQGYDQGSAQGPTQPPDQDLDEDFAETEPVEGQGKLGVMVISVTPELRRFFGVASDRGVLIARVEPGSPAAHAGIQVGDVLVRVGPQVVHTGDDVVQAIAARQGGRLRVAVVRQGHPLHLVAFVSTGATNQNQLYNQNQLNNQSPPINQNGQTFHQNGSSNGSPQNQL